MAEKKARKPRATQHPSSTEQARAARGARTVVSFRVTAETRRTLEDAAFVRGVSPAVLVEQLVASLVPQAAPAPEETAG